MEAVLSELGLRCKPVSSGNSSGDDSSLVVAYAPRAWLRRLAARARLSTPAPSPISSPEATPHCTEVFIRVFPKRNEKVLPLPKSKMTNDKIDSPMSFSQLLCYISNTNHRYLWKESYKKHLAQYGTNINKENSTINVLDYNVILTEVILRLYGCKIVKIKTDPSDPNVKTSEVVSGKYASRVYETHCNLLPVICAVETEQYIFVIHHFSYKNNLLDCVTFSPALLECNYGRRLFIIYQLLQIVKSMNNRGLYLGELKMEDIYISENLWIQIIPRLTSNINIVNSKNLYETCKSLPTASNEYSLRYPKKNYKSVNESGDKCRRLSRDELVNLEKVCYLWVKGCLSNLDYLLHLNRLAGRSIDEPSTHPVIPWVTNFTSRCGKDWRDLTKSKFRLNKGDKQLDMTFDMQGKDFTGLTATNHTPHHVSDVLSDITYYVYMARRTPKNVLCQYVRNNWVPAEYPSSIQRMQEWTPDECIPEFFTDPSVFRSIHEDLSDLQIPAWATCIEDFVVKHREALESIQVSESLHHWIDLTFGYKLSGSAAIKAKNVCLSLVDGHMDLNKSGPVQLFNHSHPARLPYSQGWGEKLPPRIVWQKDKKKSYKINDSSDEASDGEEDTANIPQNYSNLYVSSHRHSEHSLPRNKSSSRSHSRKKVESNSSDNIKESPSRSVSEVKISSPHTGQHRYKVQKSEYGKGTIYLPKEYNPLSQLVAFEHLHNFKVKTFYSATNVNSEENIKKTFVKATDTSDDMFETENELKHFPDIPSDSHSYTNQIFVESYEQNYLKRHGKSDVKDNYIKEKKDRNFNIRFVTNSSLFKETSSSNRKKDMQIIGCLIVELFLYHKIRPLSTTAAQNFDERFKVCRLVLKNNYNLLPKCVRHVACLLLQINDKSGNDTLKNVEEIISQNLELDASEVNYPCITKSGFPQCSAVQFLQPLLSNHLLPFPNYFSTLNSIFRVVHEYSIAERELDIFYSFECDGNECSKYQTLDKTKFCFIQKIAESKVRSCTIQFEELTDQLTSFSQFDGVDIFLPHFIELLQNKDTSILAAWYLFDPIAKLLGPVETSKKLLKLILGLYDERASDKNNTNPSAPDGLLQNVTVYSNRKSIKFYHHIFLLQLIVRFGLQCFLENFIPHLVEAVGGYKDVVYKDTVMHSHVNGVEVKPMSSIKKLNYCEDSLKVTSNILQDAVSPDTSYGSENLLTPIDKDLVVKTEKTRTTQIDSVADTDVFHFENEGNKDVGDIDNWDTIMSNKAKIKHLLDEMDSECRSPNLDCAANLEILECNNSVEENKSEKESEEGYSTLNINKTLSVPSSDKYGTVKSDSMSSTSVTFKSYISEIEDMVSVPELEENQDTNKNLHATAKSLRKNSFNSESSDTQSYNISEMTSKSLIWLAHRLGPVLTCKYVTRNLLKMLTLCYIGKENLTQSKEKKESSKDLDCLCITNGNLVGDANAANVIRCLTSIADLYGEQLILVQYFPHMGDLIASARKRMTRSLEGGVISCFQLLRYLIPFISDVKLMEQLQDIILKNIIHPTIRLISSTRTTFPSGKIARIALAKKFLETLYVVALRIGPEMTRKLLCVPALERFCLTFDRFYGPPKEWKESDPEQTTTEKEQSQDIPDIQGTSSDDGAFLEICRDGSTAEWHVRDGVITGDGDAAAVANSPLQHSEYADASISQILEEIRAVFTCELAHQLYIPFQEFVGKETMHRSLSNYKTLEELCRRYKHNMLLRHNKDFTNESQANKSNDNTNQDQISEASMSADSNVFLEKTDSIPFKRYTNNEESSNSNSFGSNVAIVGNRIDVQDEPNYDNVNKTGRPDYMDALQIVSFSKGFGTKENRYLRGNWLMYWEHEIGRSEKDTQFDLKQIKLQTFSGHANSVRNIVCLDNENSFMTGSKDKTVKLWSLRSQGDGSYVAPCQWTYNGHRKGILSLSFLESQRVTVSTDATVHIWDPYLGTTIAQLDNNKTAPVSIVKAMPAPSSLILAAVAGTPDTLLKIIDARTFTYSHELRVCFNPNTFIRCICVSPSGKWVAVGLATGHLSLIDIRTGMLIAYWKAHDGEVLQLVTVNEKTIVSSSLDQTVFAWSTIDGKLKFQLKGSTEPVHCLAVYYNELISGTTNNRIGVHTAVSPDAAFSSTKLRSDTFKGVLTSMCILPLNRMLLLGGEGGCISLLC